MARIKNGSSVYHAHYGPGTVQGTQKITVGDVSQMCYVVELVSGSQLMLPVNQSEQMRTLSSVAISDQIYKILSSTPVTLDADYRQRRAEIQEMVNSGDPLHSAAIFRDLVWREHTTQLSGTDRDFMKSTMKRLIDLLSLQVDLDARQAAQWLRLTIQTIILSWPAGKGELGGV